MSTIWFSIINELKCADAIDVSYWRAVNILQDELSVRKPFTVYKLVSGKDVDEHEY